MPSDLMRTCPSVNEVIVHMLVFREGDTSFVSSVWQGFQGP